MQGTYSKLSNFTGLVHFKIITVLVQSKGNFWHSLTFCAYCGFWHYLGQSNLVFYPFFIIVVIIMRPREKPWEKNNSDNAVIWVSNWFKWANLFKISSLMSQFSTNKRTLSMFCCFLFAVFKNCWSTTPSF